MMRGTVCSNAGTYGSVGTVGEQSPTVTWSAEVRLLLLETAGKKTSEDTPICFGTSVDATDRTKEAAELTAVARPLRVS